MGTAPGEVTLLPRADGLPLLRALLRDLQPAVHGMAVRRANPPRFPGAAEHWYAVARDEDGTVCGVLPYQMDLDNDTLRVTEMEWSTVAGRNLLLEWIARHVDQVRIARIPLPADSHPETWFPGSWVSCQQHEPDGTLMARVLSVPALAGITVGDLPDEVTLRITDPLIAANDQVWTLRSHDGRLAVTEGGTPQATVSVQALTALVYAGADPAEFVHRGWGDPPADVQQQLRVLFPPAVPYLSERF